MKSCTMEKIILCLTIITAAVAIPFKPYPPIYNSAGAAIAPGGYVVTSAKYSNDDKSCSNFATMQSLTYVPINTCIVAETAIIPAPATGFTNGANPGQSYQYSASTIPYSSSNPKSNTTVVWISTWNGVSCGTNNTQSIVDYRPLRTTCQCSGGSCQSNNYYVKSAPLPPATYSGNYVTTT